MAAGPVLSGGVARLPHRRSVSTEGIASQRKLMAEAGVHFVRAADVPRLHARTSINDKVVAAKCIVRARGATSRAPSKGATFRVPRPKAQQSSGRHALGKA